MAATCTVTSAAAVDRLPERVGHVIACFIICQMFVYLGMS